MIGAEFDSPRVRHLRARYDWGGRFSGHAEPVPGAPPVPPLFNAINWINLSGGLYAEASLFNSGLQEALTGRSWVPGAWTGGYLGFDHQILSMFVEMYGGVNRINSVEHVLDTAGHGELGVRFLGRVGW